MTTLPRCLHKRLIIRFLWLLCILGAFYTLAVFALWSRASIPPHNSRGLISAGPGTFKAHNSPNQPSNAASQPSSTPQLQRIQQADASEQSSATASQSPGRVFVHTFYYAWYGTLQVDGAWIHICNRDAAISKQYPKGTFNPNLGQIGADFYPAEAVYSSADRSKVDVQVAQIVGAGIGVAVVSWWGRKEVFPAGKQCSEIGWNSEADTTLDMFMDACERGGLKVSFHIEPYPERSERSVREDLMHIIHRFGQHKALYRLSAADPRPVFYIYDSYQTSASSWANIFSVGGRESIRNTRYDVVALGLWVEEHHGGDLATGGFDGFYTYFASDGFVYGSSRANWPSMVNFATKNGMLSSISVGPGYSDSRVRPWNQRNTKDRRGGQYYRESWSAAAALNPSFISITSWNEWHEGTQIEDCMPASLANAQSEMQDIASSSPYMCD